MKNLLQKLPFWPSGGKPGPSAAVSEQRLNADKLKPEDALDDQQRASERAEWLDKKIEERDEEMDSPRPPNYEP